MTRKQKSCGQHSGWTGLSGHDKRMSARKIFFIECWGRKSSNERVKNGGKIMNKKWLLVFTIMVTGAILCAGCTQASQSEKTNTSAKGFKTVVDSRGVAVKVPTDLHFAQGQPRLLRARTRDRIFAMQPTIITQKIRFLRNMMRGSITQFSGFRICLILVP